MSHLTPSPHPLSLVLLCHVLSSRVNYVPRLCPRTSRPPSPPPSLLPLLSSPHPLSLCLVCLPSQLLSKKRGLFRIHAGRKQRYPRQQACARGTLKCHKTNNTTPTPSLTHTSCSPCLKRSNICGLVWRLAKCYC